MPVPGSEVDAGNRVGRLQDLLFVEGHHYSALVRKPYGCIVTRLTASTPRTDGWRQSEDALCGD